MVSLYIGLRAERTGLLNVRIVSPDELLPTSPSTCQSGRRDRYIAVVLDLAGSNFSTAI
jgi:hypothetical protein